MTTQPADTLEQRVSRLEGAYEQVNERMGDLTQRLESLRAETNQGFASIRADLNSRFNILLVLIGALWATTVAGFIALFTRL